MKQKLCNILMLLLAILLSAALFSPAAFAASSVVQLPFKITIEGPAPNPAEVYTIRLTAADESFPMPNAGFGGSYDLKVSGPGNKVFPPIEFKTVGIYVYTMQQIPGTNPNCRYDTKGYTVTVYVTNAEGGGYDVTMAIHKDGMSSKSDEADFHDVYRPPATPIPWNKPITPTGVADHWVMYLTGSVLLLLVSAWIIRLLRRKEDE